MKKIIFFIAVVIFTITAINFGQIKIGKSVELTMSELITKAKADGENPSTDCFWESIDMFSNYYYDECNSQSIIQSICWAGGDDPCSEGWIEFTVMQCIASTTGYFIPQQCSD